MIIITVIHTMVDNLVKNMFEPQYRYIQTAGRSKTVRNFFACEGDEETMNTENNHLWVGEKKDNMLNKTSITYELIYRLNNRQQ